MGVRINDRTSALTLVFVLSFRYWRYNEDMRTMDPGYPKPITVWKGIPDSPQGAFVDKANGWFWVFLHFEFISFSLNSDKKNPICCLPLRSRFYLFLQGEGILEV